jgi:hypothetical protein
MPRLLTLLMLAPLAAWVCQVGMVEAAASGASPHRTVELDPAASFTVEARGKAKPPRKKKEPRKRPVNLSRCLDSCAAGGQVLVSFCNDIDDAVIQARCFSKLRESEQNCIGFCRNYFSR